jgi:hypothetical protein
MAPGGAFPRQPDRPGRIWEVCPARTGPRPPGHRPAPRPPVELDSWSFHSTRTDFERDRDRDADHLTDGIPTIRITHERITNTPDAEATRLHKVLASRA